jgi:radical SAM protein with 4Fe4S-binding SPASM domain
MLIINQSEAMELKLEITDRCNACCSFCHQDFGNLGRSSMMSVATGKKWINWAVKQGISQIRFTGGEPTLHPNLEELCVIAAAKGLEITINTNGLLDFRCLDRLSGYVRTLKVSLPSSVPDICDQLTGVPGSFARKLSTIGLACEAGFNIDILTVISVDILHEIEEFMALIDDLPGVCWVPLRMESSPQATRPLSKSDIQMIAETFYNLMKKYPGRLDGVRLAVPFCAVEPIELGLKVFQGRAEECGPFRSLTVTSEGRLISCYSCREEILSNGCIEEVLKDSVVLERFSLGNLPIRCRECSFVKRCMGGCANPYARAVVDDGFVDYLARGHDAS